MKKKKKSFIMDRPNSVLLGFLIEGNQRTIYFHYLMNKMKKKKGIGI